MDDNQEITITIPQELKKRIEELEEELDMGASDIFKEALKYYIDLMDIDEALESDPFTDEAEEGEAKSMNIDDYDLPPLIDEEDYSDYPQQF
ncbi:MAG: ribbon-helix-helix domain-containing protein [Campylobacterota bacterium]|nr:ribbon-helix-helix domain-containing protein [Campylobacterota bacterium]